MEQNKSEVIKEVWNQRKREREDGGNFDLVCCLGEFQSVSIGQEQVNIKV